MTPRSPAAILKRHPGAAQLAVYDGRERIGLVVDTRAPRRGAPPAPAFAFDREHRPLGEFPSRRTAVAAISPAERDMRDKRDIFWRKR